MKLLQGLANQHQVFDGSYVPGENLEHTISNLSFQSTVWGGVILITLIIIAALVRERLPKLKMPLFLASTFTVVSVTAILIGATIYLNVTSASGGPVHWHADTEIWACGQELELRDPTGALSNKIGTSTLHEHNDKRIHLEGVVVNSSDASLGKYFHVLGGVLTENALKIPLNSPEDGPYFDDRDEDYEPDQDVRSELTSKYFEVSRDGDFATFIDGQTCPDGTIADVQTFVYEVGLNPDGSIEQRNGKNVYYQRKLSNPGEFTIGQTSTVPDGTCLIVEFAPTKPATDKLCLQYEVQDYQLGNYIYGGVRQ